MNKLSIIGIFCLAVMLALTSVSCKQQTLEDFKLDGVEPGTVTANPTPDDILRDGERLLVRLPVRLSKPAGKAFEVAIQLQQDRVLALIEEGQLTDAVAVPNEHISAPSIVLLPFGADSSSFEVAIDIGFLERNYGNQVAFAYQLVEPGKGNELDEANNGGLITIDTREILAQDQIRYLSFANGGGELLVKDGQNYTITSSGVTIPLTINLAGVAGRSFTVRTHIDNDTVRTLVDQGKLPMDVVTLDVNSYVMDTVFQIGSNLNTHQFTVSIPWSVMDQHLGHPIALVLKMHSPSRHVLHPTDATIVIHVDPSVNEENNSFFTGNGSGLKAEYFQNNQQLDSDGSAANLIRLDERIDFVGWQPFPDTDDNWSTRWTGEFLAPVTGTYTFYQTKWDDGARLIVNGQTLVDDFTTEWDKPSRFGTIELERGKRYTIEAHHRENVGGQQAVLEFEVQSAAVERQVVPKSQLFPPADFNP